VLLKIQSFRGEVRYTIKASFMKVSGSKAKDRAKEDKFSMKRLRIKIKNKKPTRRKSQ